MTRESAFKKSILQFAAVYAVALLVIAREEVVGALSARALGTIGLLLMVGGSIFLSLRFRAINRNYKPAAEFALGSNDPAARKKITRGMRLNQVGMVAMPLILINGLLNARDVPHIGIAVGVAMNLALTWLFFKAYRIQRAKLQQLDNVAAAEPGNTQ
jgi:hypothetical protein